MPIMEFSKNETNVGISDVKYTVAKEIKDGKVEIYREETFTITDFYSYNDPDCEDYMREEGTVTESFGNFHL